LDPGSIPGISTKLNPTYPHFTVKLCHSGNREQEATLPDGDNLSFHIFEMMPSGPALH
jgi:hypothetical protein